MKVGTLGFASMNLVMCFPPIPPVPPVNRSGSAINRSATRIRSGHAQYAAFENRPGLDCKKSVNTIVAQTFCWTIAFRRNLEYFKVGANESLGTQKEWITLN